MDSIIRSYLKAFPTKDDIDRLIRKIEGLEQMIAGSKVRASRSGKVKAKYL